MVHVECLKGCLVNCSPSLLLSAKWRKHKHLSPARVRERIEWAGAVGNVPKPQGGKDRGGQRDLRRFSKMEGVCGQGKGDTGAPPKTSRIRICSYKGLNFPLALKLLRPGPLTPCPQGPGISRGEGDSPLKHSALEQGRSNSTRPKAGS